MTTERTLCMPSSRRLGPHALPHCKCTVWTLQLRQLGCVFVPAARCVAGENKARPAGTTWSATRLRTASKAKHTNAPIGTRWAFQCLCESLVAHDTPSKPHTHGGRLGTSVLLPVPQYAYDHHQHTFNSFTAEPPSAADVEAACCTTSSTMQPNEYLCTSTRDTLQIAGGRRQHEHVHV